MDEKKHDYLLLFAAAILVLAVCTGVFLHKLPTGSAAAVSGISGSFALGTCDELANLFKQNQCDGQVYDGYTCMKISEALQQMGCLRNQL